jgi:hypothetical protein
MLFHLKTFVKNHAKEVLISPTLDVYCSHPVRGAPAAGRTLLEQVMVSLMLPDIYRLKCLIEQLC